MQKCMCIHRNLLCLFDKRSSCRSLRQIMLQTLRLGRIHRRSKRSRKMFGIPQTRLVQVTVVHM